MKVACITLLILALTVCAVLCDNGPGAASTGKAVPPSPAPAVVKQKPKGNDDTSANPVESTTLPIPHSETLPSDSTKTSSFANKSGAIVPNNNGASEKITTPVPSTTPIPTSNTTTPMPVTNSTTTVKPPDTTVPPTPSPNPNTTTSAPTTTTINPDTTTHPTTSTTLKPTPTTPSHSTTAIPSTTQHPPSRHFDGLSFVGGIILATCLMAVGAFLWKFSRTCSEGNYRTL